MDARIILQTLIERLQPEVAGFGDGPRGAWGTDAALREWARTGNGHKAEALAIARDALKSGDERRIEDAAKLAPTFERTGVDLAKRYQEIERKRRGGKARGAKQHETAATAMRPYVDLYYTLLTAGTPYLKARRLVAGQMVKDAKPAPSKPTIAKWFPKK
jgi:hypothetical protein